MCLDIVAEYFYSQNMDASFEQSRILDRRLARLVEVARAYYLEHQTQAEIARSLGISRSQVSRYLTSARELGIVQIRITLPSEETSGLRDELRHRFPHLRDVIVAPAFSGNREAIRTLIGRFAANFVMDTVQPGHSLALGCGRTLRAMVDALPERYIPGVTVVQAMGNIGHEAHNIDYNEIARKAADAMVAQVHYLSAPAILGPGSGRAAALVAANPMLEQALSLARRADVYIVGLGSLESDQLYARLGLIQHEELNDLKGRAVGDICGRFFDLSGREQRSVFDERIVGIELDDLRRAQFAIGVAGGPDKAAPLLGALRGNLINVLISDEQTIHSVLALDDTYS
jgi:deoxyribonucleoside regulator